MPASRAAKRSSPKNPSTPSKRSRKMARSFSSTSWRVYLSFGGQEMDQPGGATVTQTRDARGKLVDYKQEGEAPQAAFSPEIQRLMAAVQDLLLPEKAVKPGDTWTTEIEN